MFKKITSKFSSSSGSSEDDDYREAPTEKSSIDSKSKSTSYSKTKPSKSFGSGYSESMEESSDYSSKGFSFSSPAPPAPTGKNLTVMVKTETITFSINVFESDTIDTLYTKVAQRSEYKKHQFELTFYDEPLEKTSTISGSGIEEESSVKMNLLKELTFIVKFKSSEYCLSIPNNDGLTIQHLNITAKKNLSDSIPEVCDNEFYFKKGGNPIPRAAPLHNYLSNKDIVELVLGENVSDKSYNAETADDEQLLKSFLENAISSDVEIVFCFDTTGSMSSIIAKVREQVEQTVSRLMKDIPNIRIGIMGLGDYCDGKNVLTTLDLTQDVGALVKFIKSVPSTSGGDAPEAYEWALRKAKSLAWSPHTSKAFVMIGDCEPHEPSHTDLKMNWFAECDDLYDMGVKIYGVKALGSCVFYEEIAERTGGICINFNKFSLITEMFLAICYREASKEKLSNYEKEIANKNDGVSAELTEIFTDLKKENFKVIDTTDKNNNNDTTTTSSNTVKKQRGKPIKMRIQASWFNHELDSPTTPPQYVYDKKGDYFTARK